MTEKVYGIESGYFNAGIVIVGKKVIDAAPIVRYMVGWNVYRVKAYLKKKGWKAFRCKENADEQ